MDDDDSDVGQNRRRWDGRARHDKEGMDESKVQTIVRRVDGRLQLLSVKTYQGLTKGSRASDSCDGQLSRSEDFRRKETPWLTFSLDVAVLDMNMSHASRLLNELRKWYAFVLLNENISITELSLI